MGLVSLALLLAGCGGGSNSPSVANLGSTTSSSTLTNSTSASPAPVGSGSASPSGAQTGASMKMVGASVADDMKFAACMRSNGVPSFPDPNAQGVFSFTGIDANSAGFQKAMKTCQKVMPNGGVPTPAQQAQMKAQMLKLSQCMRANGEPNFPDPSANGSLSLSSGSGIDPQSPQFQAAQKTCAKDFPGGTPP